MREIVAHFQQLEFSTDEQAATIIHTGKCFVGFFLTRHRDQLKGVNLGLTRQSGLPQRDAIRARCSLTYNREFGEPMNWFQGDFH